MAKVSLRAYNREIETMIDRGHLDEAIANCRHILKIFPKHIETYRLLGKSYLEYKKYPEAVDIFSRVLAAVPDDFVANVGMSIIRDEENKLDDAIWHMERAFETQPSNAAIQSELQRLYGRRDGVQPPRIRMTRGALAHMYVQGELYPQAISEIKSVLNEDSGRVDMQALLARAYYRSGLKNDAADTASSVLRTYPQCLDANRVLMEILGSDRSESAQIYRQRVVELDPYAAHATGSVFQSNEAPEAAVNLERLDWNGQPVGMQPDWGTTEAISLDEGGVRDEQPDWLKNVFDEPAARSSQSLDSPTIIPGADAAQDQPKVVPAFDSSLSHPTGAEPSEDIPGFLREAGWGQSTGAFDESKSALKYEEPVTEPPIAKGELPDWVKAMAPVETEQPADEEEELPDWINKLGTGVASTPLDSGEQPDWISQLDQPAQAQAESRPSDDQADWLKGLDQSEQTAPSSDQPDWLKGFSNESDAMPAASPEQPDWISQLDQPTQAKPESQPSSDQLDWLKQLDQPEQAVSSASDDQPDWLKGFGSESESTPTASTEQPDWLGQLGEQAEPALSEPSITEFDVPAQTETEPESVLSAPLSSDLDSPVASTEETEEPLPASPVSSMMDNLGTSEQERDDSFAWLENLAARQGASEGLLTKPEDRLEEEPDWVKRAKGIDTDQAPAPSAPPAQTAGSLEELGKSEQERDDSFAWLENLAARQGASEGLLTKPEERLEQEPDWVRQARDLGAAAEQPPMTPPVAEGPSSTDDTATWLRSLDEEETTATPLTENDATGMWLKSLDEEPVKIQPAQPAAQPEADVPAWMQNIEEDQPAQASTLSAATEELAAEEPVELPPAQPIAHAAPELPAWMQNIEEEQPAQAAPSASAEEVMAEGSDWMRSTEEAAEAQPARPEADVPAWMQNSEDEKPYESEPVVHEMAAEQPAQFDVTSEQTQNIEEEQPAPASATATPEEVTTETSEWKGSIEEPVEVEPVQPVEQREAEIPTWMQNIDEEKSSISEPVVHETEAEQQAQLDATSERMQSIEEEQPAQATAPSALAEEVTVEASDWKGSIEEPVAVQPAQPAEQPAQLDDMPEWMQYIEEKKPAEESTAATPEQATTADVSEWMGSIEEPVAQSPNLAEEKPTTESEEIPAWLSSLEQEEAQATTPAASDEDLPAWLRGEEEAAPEVSELEPTRAVDWRPLDEKEPELTSPVSEPISESFAVAEEIPELASASLEEEEIATPEPEPHKEPAAPIEAAMSAMPVDPILGQARDDLSQGNISGALSTYGKLIRKTRLLDEVIYDLRDALYRYPVEVSIWQALGDAYMRANRLQDALDSYTKAEELLR